MIFSTDGEQIIMQQAFDEEVIAAFDSVRTDYAKGPPSATSVHQPADVSTNFRSMKTGVREVDKKGKEFRSLELDQNIREAVAVLKHNFPSVSLTAPKVRKIVEGLQKIVFVMRSGYWKAGEAVQGFVECGQHVLMPAEDGEEKGLTVNYDRMMSKTLAVVSNEERLHMKEMKNHVIREFQEKGSVDGEFLDTLNIVRTEDAVDRDELCLTR
jgi:hypothetical protein